MTLNLQSILNHDKALAPRTKSHTYHHHQHVHFAESERSSSSLMFTVWLTYLSIN
jgi:hypothetical protein